MEADIRRMLNLTDREIKDELEKLDREIAAARAATLPKFHGAVDPIGAAVLQGIQYLKCNTCRRVYALKKIQIRRGTGGKLYAVCEQCYER